MILGSKGMSRQVPCFALPLGACIPHSRGDIDLHFMLHAGRSKGLFLHLHASVRVGTAFNLDNILSKPASLFKSFCNYSEFPDAKQKVHECCSERFSVRCFFSLLCHHGKKLSGFDLPVKGSSHQILRNSRKLRKHFLTDRERKQFRDLRILNEPERIQRAL